MHKYLGILNILVLVAQSDRGCNAVTFDGQIAGDRTISECINGYIPTMKIANSQMYITTSQFARELGYPAEEHTAITDDGYLLTLHRIVGKPGSPPVFLQHGLLGSSFDWIVIGKEKALGFLLADRGYDVWLGNARGNTYSRCHTTYKTTNHEFWDFSWHEIGIYDLPAMITHVANTTNQRIVYIGHSMGTTAFFVMAIERPDIASKIKLMIGLAPVAFIDHNTSPLRILAPFTRQMEFVARARETADIFTQSPALKRVLEYACTLSTIQRRICTRLVFSITGFNPQQFNYTLVPEILYHVPAGSSLKIFIHYFQEYNSARFQYFDYGEEKNWELYSSSQPPDYNISKITVPIGVFWSDDDVFANPIDVMRLYEQLPNTLFNYRVDYPNFNHNDYLYAVDAPKYVYDKLLSVLENYK